MLARKLILGFGIAIVVPMVIHYGVGLFTEWPDFTEMARLRQEQRNAPNEDRAELQERIEELQETVDAQRKRWSWNHFVVGVPLGIAVMIGGSFVAIPVIGEGLMLGGIFAFSSGCYWYWSDLPPVGRFLMMLLALAGLVWMSYRDLDALKASKGQEM